MWIAPGAASAQRWQQEANAEAPLRRVAQLKPPSMTFPPPGGDGQAKAAVAAAAPGGIQALKGHQGLIAQIWINALSLVLNGDQQPISFLL